MAAVCFWDIDGHVDNASMLSLLAALAQPTKTA
jgi:hypothetical protein